MPTQLPMRRGDAGGIVQGSAAKDLLVWDPTSRMFVPRQYVQAPTGDGSFLRSLGDEWDEFRGTQVGQIPVWGANGWALGSAGAGAIRPLAAGPNTVGLWNLQGTLANVVDPANPLTVATGATAYAPIVPGQLAFYFNGATRLTVAAFVAALAILGDHAGFSIWQFDSDLDATDTILFGHGALGETQATNIIYSHRAVGPTPPRALAFLSESGAGVNATFQTSGSPSLPPVHNVMLLAYSKQAGVVTNYVNGTQFGLPSGVLTTPDGGTSGRFQVGASDAGTTIPRALCYGVRIDNAAQSAAQHLAVYNATLGPAYGLL